MLEENHQWTKRNYGVTTMTYSRLCWKLLGKPQQEKQTQQGSATKGGSQPAKIELSKGQAHQTVVIENMKRTFSAKVMWKS